MRVLAVDTSSNVAAAAVMEDDLLLGEYILNHKKTHSQKLMVMIEQLLGDLDLTVRDIDIFAAAVGPGSFTGLRIGVATVKALAHAAGKRVVSVGTLEALAYNVPYAEHIIVPIMDARRDNVFTASYIWDGEFKEIGAPEAVTIRECVESCGNFLDTIFVGDGVKVHRDYINERLGERAIFPHGAALNSRASSVAAIALDRAKKGETQSYSEMKPYYIRKSQAERELEEKRSKANDSNRK
ncbi:MAG: tRNA (adenosine(37)-N6)-threonylcarbamoyltransferase complex dimerization subunit type 1 TsaB [Firmicutes bacterium]|nr:tRNA (adenosine(37)-N6)-threonylcarbamoyltransferase complex dimerization subunit type 1 TsaB [Bacillota bacterium]